jgi:hypothetical protein
MKLNGLKAILELQPDKFPRFILPEGDHVPDHFHLTEVGHVVKNFIVSLLKSVTQQTTPVVPSRPR